MKKSMFKTPFAIGLALIALMFTSCDLFDKADDISFDTTLEEAIVVNEPATAVSKTYSKYITLDATSDPEINKYKSKISGFKVKKVNYQVTQFTQNSVITISNASISFGDASSSAAEVLGTIPNINIKEAFDNGTVFELTLDQTKINRISSLLKDDKAVKVYVEGTLSQTPVEFEITVSLDVTVEADAL